MDGPRPAQRSGAAACSATAHHPLSTIHNHLITLLLFALAALLPFAPRVHAQILPALGGDRAGTIGFQFLKIPVDARSAALGETVVSNAFDGTSLFWNPALAAQAPGAQLTFHHAAYFADVGMDYAAASFPVGRFTLGASLQTMSSGDMDVTTEFEPRGTGETYQFIDVAAGLTLAQALTDLFSYGVTAKYVDERVAGLVTRTVVFDLGFFYRVGTTGAQIAVGIRNFGLDATPDGTLTRLVLDGDGTAPVTDFESITPPTTFLFGVSYNLFRNDARQDLMVSGQLSNPADNSESFNAGAEYTWNGLLVLRAGYRLGVDEYRTPSFGAGLILPYLGPDLRFDYGFTQRDRLGTVHRLGLNLSLSR